MAIQVICPGCMKSFEVDDRFAGKKGPCPKCGHIIEIPKVKVVVHAPDSIVDGGKTKKVVGHDARPIAQKRFTFTIGQVALGVGGAALAALVAYLVGLTQIGALSAIVGFVGLFLVAFPIADVGYMLIRDDNDLEMFLGNERHRRALFASLVFAGSWLVFEIFLYFLGGTGALACLFLIPVVVVGSFGAVIFFDCNFIKAFAVYMIFAFAAIIGRGLLFTQDKVPVGWIWQERRAARVSSSKPSANTRQTPSEDGAENASQDPPKSDATAPQTAQPEKTKISREAPKVDPTKRRR